MRFKAQVDTRLPNPKFSEDCLVRQRAILRLTWVQYHVPVSRLWPSEPGVVSVRDLRDYYARNGRIERVYTLNHRKVNSLAPPGNFILRSDPWVRENLIEGDS